MKIYTLTGPSGTGKSFSAMSLAKQNGIDAIIDDGLFIYRGSVIEGESAKKSSTKIGATKAAIFYDKTKAAKAREAIARKAPDSILILGTSDEMTDRIIERLELKPEEGTQVNRIYIEDITTEAERKQAKEQRTIYGKHVIPAPAISLKKSFAGYFLDSLARIRGKDMSLSPERTVVRPTFSYVGDYILSNRVISDICRITAEKTPAIDAIIMVTQEPSPESYRINVALKMNSGYPVWESAETYQKALTNMVEKMTAFNVAEVNIEIRGISVK